MAFPIGQIILASSIALAGAIVLFLRPSSRTHLALGAVLLVRASLTGVNALLAESGDLGTAVSYARISIWYTLLRDPLSVILALALLDLEIRRRRAIVTAAWVVAAAGALAMLLDPSLFIEEVTVFSGNYAIVSGPLYYALTAWAVGVDALVVLAALLRARTLAGTERAWMGSIALAFSFAPLHASAFFLTFTIFDLSRLAIPGFVLRAGFAVAAGALVGVALAKASRSVERAIARAIAVVLGILIVIGLADGAVAVYGGLRTFLPGYDRSILLVRALFVAVLLFGVIRFGMADAGARDRRRVQGLSRAIIATTLGASALLLAFLALGRNGLAAGAGLVAAVVAPAAGWPWVARAGDSFARRLLLPPDDPRAIAERARAYASAVAAARDAGPEGEKLLAQLRDDLGISLQEHELLVQGVASRDADRYHRIERLGHGSTAQVELALDEVAGKRVVVKRFTGLRDAPAVLREARALAAVRHPRIVPFLEVDKRGDDVHLVLAYAEGGNARKLIEREGPLPPARALALARDLLEGLEALHAAGIVHCDVKAENLLLDAEGRGMLGDFGSARFQAPDLADATLTGAGAEGSLSTISPEALRGAPPAPERDVYAAGALLYRLLTGTHYVDLQDATVFEARERILLDEPRLSHPRVPAPLIPVLRKALAKKPADRYRSARAFLDALS